MRELFVFMRMIVILTISIMGVVLIPAIFIMLVTLEVNVLRYGSFHLNAGWLLLLALLPGGLVAAVLVVAFFDVASDEDPADTANTHRDYAQQNRLTVIGWQLAEPKDLERLSPDELQAKLDMLNPFSDAIADCLREINNLQDVDLLVPEAPHMRKQLEKRVIQLRHAPLVTARMLALGDAPQLLSRTRKELQEIVPEVLIDQPTKAAHQPSKRTRPERNPHK